MVSKAPSLAAIEAEIARRSLRRDPDVLLLAAAERPGAGDSICWWAPWWRLTGS
jgi:hypothetical protein